MTNAQPTENQRDLQEDQSLIVETQVRPLVSWGAILAGLVVVLATTWMMLLLGSSIGISIADATDATTVTQGFTLGAMFWMLLTALLSFFLGSLIAGHLAGSADRTVGLLHGVTLWGLATAIMLVLTYWGLSGLVQAGTSAAATATSAAASIVTSTAETGSTAITESGQALAWAGETFAESQLADSISAKVKRRTAKEIAEMDQPGGADVSRSEVQRAISRLDSTTLQKVASDIITGDTQAAHTTLAQATKLSEKEVSEIIESVRSEIDQLAVSEQLQARVEQGTKQLAQTLSRYGGTEVTQEEVRGAIKQLDSSTLQNVATELILGDVQAAKDTLVVNTSLSEPEINSIIDGVQSDISQQIDEFQTQADQVMESISSYSQAVMWSSFVCAALGLCVSIGGGALGAAGVQRLVVRRKHEVRT